MGRQVWIDRSVESDKSARSESTEVLIRGKARARKDVAFCSIFPHVLNGLAVLGLGTSLCMRQSITLAVDERSTSTVECGFSICG
eukprot:2146756-Pleurochrysis_carterae.AAC.4